MKKILKRMLALILVVCAVMSYTAPAANAAISDLWATKRTYSFEQYETYQGADDIKYNADGSVAASNGKTEDVFLAVLGTYNGTNYLEGSASSQSLLQRYGSLYWTYEAASAGICGTTTELEHVPVCDNVRFRNGEGIRIAWGEGQWIAFRIKAPEKTGEYKVSLNFVGDPGSCTAAVYIMEAEGIAANDRATVLARQEKIHAAMDPDNRIGKADLYARSSGDNTAYIGNYNFEENKEYIVVVENYQNAELPGNNYIKLKSLYITTGTASGEVIEGDPKVNSVPVLQDAVPATDSGAMGAVLEVDGRDYFFLPREGGKMSVYDLELLAAGEKFDPVMTVDTGLYYPTHATVTDDDKVIVGGDGKRLFIFNTETMTGRNTPDFRDFAGLEGGGHNQGSFYNADDELIYFGTLYDGHMACYDMKSGAFEDLGDMVCADIQRKVFPKLKDSEIDNNGAVRSVVCCDGYAYGLATSDRYSILVKYNLAKEKTEAVEKAIDVAPAMGLATNARQMTVLGNDYIIIGGSGVEGMTLVDLKEFALVTIDDVVAKGLFASKSTYAKDAWEYGMNGHATEVVGDKQYFYIQDTGLYSYNVDNGQMAFESSAGKPFKTGQKTTVTLDIDKDGVDELYLFTYANGGQPRLFNVSTKELTYLSGLDVDLENAAGSSINIGTDYEGVLYIGAWNNWNCVAYDTAAEKVKSRYVTGGQTDSQTYFVDENGKFHLISGNYSACVVYEIDPENPTYTDKDGNPSNIISPLIFTMKNYDQKRIHTVAAGDGYIFAGTIPTSNRNGGGVGVFKYGSELGTEEFLHFKENPTLTTSKKVTVQVDSKTAKTVTIGPENVVPEEFSELWDLSVNGIVYHDELLYGATSRSGGSGSSMKEGTSAHIFVMDYKDSDGDGTNLEILATLDLRDYLELVDADGDGVEDPINYVGGITADPLVSGRFWGIVSDVLFAFTYNKDDANNPWTVQEVLPLGIKEYKSSGGVDKQNRKVVFDTKNNQMFVSFYNAGMQAITLEDWNASVGSIQVVKNEKLLTSEPETYALGVNDNLYYAEGVHLYMKPVNVVDSDWTEAEKVDALIKELKVDTKDEIAEVKEAYNNLTPRQKALVQESRALLEIEAQALEMEIADALKNVTADSMNALAELIHEYNELDPSQQRYVQNFPALEEAYDTSIDMVNNALAYAVQDQIEALPGEITLADEEAVIDAREAYDGLDADLQAKVNNLAKLEAAEAAIAALKAEAEAVEAQINALNNITLADEAKVTAARAAYDQLSDAQKELVDDTKLVAAEARILVLKGAKEVQDQINALDNITLADEAKVVAARDAYLALSEEAQAEVNITKLEAALARIAVLKAAKAVYDKIEALPAEVTLENEATVKAARKAYEALSAEAQAEVTNVAKLEAAESRIAALKTAQAVEAQINALPDNVALADKYKILAARQAYEALSDELKANVETAKLEAAEEQLETLMHATPSKQFYDFELYNNADFASGFTYTTINSNFDGHRAYDDTITIAQWFYNNYPGTINWGMETAAGSNGTLKDFSYRGKNAQGVRMQATKVDQYVSIRIHVPAAGLYTVDLKAGSTPSTFDLYIFEAATDYATAQTAKSAITAAMTEENRLVDNYSMTAEQEAALGQWTFNQPGDYIVVFKAEAAHDNGISMRNMTLTPVVNEETAVAQVGGEYFLSLEQAFAYQAENGADCVTLNKDVQVEYLHLESNQILDLNGHTLTVDSIKSYASSGIIDNSEKDTGVLVVKDEGGLMLDENNSQLPIYDVAAGGYRFFEISVKSVAITGKDGGNAKYWFKVSCENFDEIYKLIQAGRELNITVLNITVRMTWNGGEATATADPAFLNQWAEKYAAAGDSFYITVSAVNAEGYENFSLLPCMEANGVAVKGKGMK